MILEVNPMPQGRRNIKMFYKDYQDGGGLSFGLEYAKIIAGRYPNRVFKKCYEWCSGPGVIGYYLLSHELCNSLCLSDMYAPAIDSANITANYAPNNCKDQVSTYVFDDLELMPTEEQFDLVVANPPHFVNKDNLTEATDNQIRRAVDKDWAAHQNFFKHIGKHLLPNGVILLQENMYGSTVETFAPYIQDAGLVITDWFKSNDWWYPPESDLSLKIYYIEIQKK
jgi:methylase of polypeptide subunit release factors